MLAIWTPAFARVIGELLHLVSVESRLTSSVMRISMASKPAALARLKHSGSGVPGGKMTEQMLFCEPRSSGERGRGSGGEKLAAVHLA